MWRRRAPLLLRTGHGSTNAGSTVVVGAGVERNREGALARAYMSSSQAKKQHQVVHMPDQHKFAIIFDDGDQAVLEYEERDGGKVWDLVHTYTPPSKRGQGIAAQVVNGAMEQIKREGKVKVVASCWYVRDDFLPKHPEYADCVATNAKI